jgi:hypothetical protein
VTATETTLETPTRTLYLYGKNGKAQGPTKAYPHSTLVKLEAELVKDFGQGIAVWKFPAYKDIQPEKYWVYHHHDTGAIGTGGECESKETAFDRAERGLVFREYTEKRRELYREHREGLDRLEEEYKGRI